VICILGELNIPQEKLRDFEVCVVSNNDVFLFLLLEYQMCIVLDPITFFQMFCFLFFYSFAFHLSLDLRILDHVTTFLLDPQAHLHSLPLDICVLCSLFLGFSWDLSFLLFDPLLLLGVCFGSCCLPLP